MMNVFCWRLPFNFHTFTTSFLYYLTNFISLSRFHFTFLIACRWLMWYDQSMSIWTLSLKSMLPFNRNFLISDVWVTFSNEVFGKYFKKTLNATVVYFLSIQNVTKNITLYPYVVFKSMEPLLSRHFTFHQFLLPETWLIILLLETFKFQEVLVSCETVM